MEKLQLLDAVERYLQGSMGPEEVVLFEQLRKSDPEVDQLVVEHTMFLQQLDKFGDWKNFKSSLNEVHNQLVESGDIKNSAPRATVIQLWKKYKKVMAVAASIAGITTLLIAAIATYYNKQANEQAVRELGRKLTKDIDIKVAKKTTEALNASGVLSPTPGSKVPENANPLFGGTGFLIDGKGYLVTNSHVLKGSSSVLVENNKNQKFHAIIIYKDEAADIAVLKIQDEDYKPFTSLPYGIHKGNVALGEPLFTLGYPRDEIVYNEGYMSAQTGYEGDTLNFQVGMAANPGNSGGPVFNKNGEVIGIIKTRQEKAEGVVFALTTANIFRALEEIRKDTAYQNVKLPSSSALKGLDRTQQNSKIIDYVFMVKSYQSK